MIQYIKNAMILVLLLAVSGCAALKVTDLEGHELPGMPVYAPSDNGDEDKEKDYVSINSSIIGTNNLEM